MSAIKCSERDTLRFLDDIEKRDEQVEEIYQSGGGGAINEIYKIFLDNLEQFKKQAEDSYYYIDDDIKEAKRAIDINDLAIKKLNEKITKCNRQIEENRSKISKMDARISALSSKRASIPSDPRYDSVRSSFDSAIRSCRDTREDCHKAINDLQRAINEYEALIKRIEQMIDNLNKIIESAERARREIETAVEKREALLSDIGYMLGDVSKAYQSYKSDMMQTASSARTASGLVSSLYDTFFALTDSTPDRGEPIEVKSADAFSRATKSLKAASDAIDEGKNDIAELTVRLSMTIQDELTEDAKNNITPLREGLGSAALYLTDTSRLTRRCHDLLSSYISLA